MQPECARNRRRIIGLLFLFRHLAKKGISDHVLEVMVNNAKAIRVYEKIGFKVIRTVACFRGRITHPGSSGVEIREIAFENLDKFWDFTPTFQNRNASVTLAPDLHRTFGAFSEGNLAGYIVFAKANHRVKQFGVAHARKKKGLGEGFFTRSKKPVSTKTFGCSRAFYF